jgi:serine/threonine protein kinase
MEGVRCSLTLRPPPTVATTDYLVAFCELVDHGRMPKRSLEIVRMEVAGGFRFALSGCIDDTLALQGEFSNLKGVVILDLAGVDQITSSGVRRWRTVIGELACEYLGFLNCRPQLASQFSSVARFNAGGELISFFLPYTCTACGHYEEHLLDLRRDHAAAKAHEAPARRCSKCGGASEFDDEPSTYFYYAAYAPAPSPSMLANTIIDGTTSVGSAPFRVTKDVEDQVTALWLSGNLDKTVKLKRVASGLDGVLLLETSGILRVEEEGTSQLGTLLDTVEVPTFLARVPMSLARALAARPGRSGKATLCSYWVPRVCSKCTARSEGELRELPAKGGEDAAELGRCDWCGGRLRLSLTSAESEALAELRLQSAGEAIVRYLQSHQSAPKVDPTRTTEGREASEIFGRYELVERIGVGGMAEVYLAKQAGAAGFEKWVVLKKILPNLATDKVVVDMFIQEARLAARISHANVVQTLDMGQTGNDYFIALEFVRGLDLSTLLKICAKLSIEIPTKVALRIVADLCRGLQAAHSATDDQGKPTPIIHRDVSPHNILVSMDGFAKLSDFGIAKAKDSMSATPTATLRGKTLYLPPELLSGGAPKLDGRIDTYAAGLVLYQCLTGKHPFWRENTAETLQAIIDTPVPEVKVERGELPPEVDAIIRQATAKKQAERFASAAEMAAALESLVEATPSLSRTDLAAWVDDVLRRAKQAGAFEVNVSRTMVRVMHKSDPDHTDTPVVKTSRASNSPAAEE